MINYYKFLTIIVKISIKIMLLYTDYKLQHQLHMSDFFAQLGTLSTKSVLPYSSHPVTFVSSKSLVQCH